MSIYRQGPAPANTCPRCRETLLGVGDVEGVKVCEKCGGVFADVAASRKIVSTLDRVLLEIGFQSSLGKARRSDDGRSISCPECLTTMQRVPVESAACFVDACPTHGTWFDVGELEDVIRSYARTRRKVPVPAPSIAAGLTPPIAKPAPDEQALDQLVYELMRS